MRRQPITVRLLTLALALVSLSALTGCDRDTDAAVAECCKKLPVDQRSPAALPDDSIYQLASAWQTDDGKTIRLGELKGHPLVVAMIFTNCEYACPLIVNDLKRLDATLAPELRKNVRYLLVTFDLKRDTVQALHAYRARVGLSDDHRWTLARSAAEDDTFELAALLGVKYKLDARGQFAHSNLFSILDPAGRLVHQQLGLNDPVTESAAVLSRLAQ